MVLEVLVGVLALVLVDLDVVVVEVVAVGEVEVEVVAVGEVVAEVVADVEVAVEPVGSVVSDVGALLFGAADGEESPGPADAPFAPTSSSAVRAVARTATRRRRRGIRPEIMTTAACLAVRS